MSFYGAYALYPGYFDGKNPEKNPYHEAIDEIDIGAFPFLPGKTENWWLIDFLGGRLGLTLKSDDSYAIKEGMPTYAHSNRLKSSKILLKNQNVSNLF
ncbi:hypothetical protein [Thiomicrorhabdus aquaedulcis]|uniref:hypothetical protein n=1 Tax=Thiomicrorhabdus aquaedulcis TaxID=2211106 RepID=UPI000FD72E8D|nr:hypothetical protein [Thiomicrorhabdus aquaedulcis]